MQDDTAKAKRYRERAKQIRRISVDVRGEADQKTLLNVAKDYDAVAKALEADRAPGKPGIAIRDVGNSTPTIGFCDSSLKNTRHRALCPGPAYRPYIPTT